MIFSCRLFFFIFLLFSFQTFICQRKEGWTCSFPSLHQTHKVPYGHLGADQYDHCLQLLAVYELHESSWDLGGWLDGNSASPQGEETKYWLSLHRSSQLFCAVEQSQSFPERELDLATAAASVDTSTKGFDCFYQFWSFVSLPYILYTYRYIHFVWLYLEFRRIQENKTITQIQMYIFNIPIPSLSQDLSVVTVEYT